LISICSRYLQLPATITFLVLILPIVGSGCGKTATTDDREALKAAPQRIVSMAPNVTELLFAMGIGDRVVGVTDFCNHPPEARTKRRIGGVLNPNLEAILALEPDLVINIPGQASQQIMNRLRDLGTHTLTTRTDTIEEIFAAIEEIGQATGATNGAETLARKMRAGLQETSDRVKGRPRAKVLFAIGHDPLYLAGSGTFIDGLIEMAGGTNIASGAVGMYPRFNMEEVIKRAPDVIIDASMGSAFSPEDREKRRDWWLRWDSIPAVKNDRIYGLDTDELIRPGPRIVDALREVARVIHPEVFEEPPE